MCIQHPALWSSNIPIEQEEKHILPKRCRQCGMKAVIMVLFEPEAWICKGHYVLWWYSTGYSLNLVLLFSGIRWSAVSWMGFFRPCRNAVRLLICVWCVQCHLLPNWRGKTSPGQFTCHQTDGTRGLRLWGQSVRLAEASSLWGGGEGGVFFFFFLSLCGSLSLRNLPLLLSKDQLSATVTKTPCTSSSLNPVAPNLDAETQGQTWRYFSVCTSCPIYLNYTLLFWLYFSGTFPLFFSGRRRHFLVNLWAYFISWQNPSHSFDLLYVFIIYNLFCFYWWRTLLTLS